MVFYAAFNNISVISWRQLTFFMSFLGFTSTRLGSEVSCPRTLPRKNPEDPVRLEPRNPGLRVKHFTIEPRGTGSFVRVNSLPNDKILDLSNLKGFADNNLNVNQKLKFALGRVENIVGKGENAVYQHFFSFSHNVFKRLLS